MQKRLTHTVGSPLSSASTEADNEHQFIAREIAGSLMVQREFGFGLSNEGS